MRVEGENRWMVGKSTRMDVVKREAERERWIDGQWRNECR